MSETKTPLTYGQRQAARMAANPDLAKRVEDYENVPTAALPAFVLLGRKRGDNAYMGFVENSFSLGTSKDQTFVFWSGWGGKIDGKSWAEKDLAILCRRADEEWEMFNVEEPLPVELDWRKYHWGHEADSMTMSGVRDKYAARNVDFKMAENDAGVRAISEQRTLPPEDQSLNTNQGEEDMASSATSPSPSGLAHHGEG